MHTNGTTGRPLLGNQSTTASGHRGREVAAMQIKGLALGVLANCKSWPSTLEMNARPRLSVMSHFVVPLADVKGNSALRTLVQNHKGGHIPRRKLQIRPHITGLAGMYHCYKGTFFRCWRFLLQYIIVNRRL
jgi:hypothetical protein